MRRKLLGECVNQIRRVQGAECDLMNVRGNVQLTKVSEIRDREQVVMALVNNAMPQDDIRPPLFHCPNEMHASDLPSCIMKPHPTLLHVITLLLQ